MKTLDIRSTILNFTTGRKYFAVEALRKYLTRKSLRFKAQTVRQYAYDLKAKGVIHDAGYGWYSTIEKPFSLDTSPLSDLVTLLSKKFPLLPFSCWTTAQIQGYSHHIPVRFVTLLNVDVDDVMPLFEYLRGENFNVYANPGKAETAKQFMIGDRTIVLRPNITEAPVEAHYASIEKLLVDLFVEKDRLMLMDNAEYERVARNILDSGRINMARMLRYARRREMRRNLVNALHHADKNLVCE
ncbi:MAG: hypothetical protein NTU47_02310 [Ignavibacteriales bacterium]|nr:hypothetical protein [Ignavibacteriales bacterium]